MEKVASFNWKSWIARIEVAVRENEVLKIDIPRDEWMKLVRGGRVALEKQLSKDAVRKLHLIKEADRNYLLVARYGRCPS